MKRLCIVLLLCSWVLSCTKQPKDWSEEQLMEVASVVVPVKIFGDPDTTDGMLVRTMGEKNWTPQPVHSIEGFDFEEGYVYILSVQITHLANPPQDSADTICRLIAVISKIRDDAAISGRG